MSSSSAPSVAPAWLYGPGRDLLLGCGLGYVVLGLVFMLPAVSHGAGAWIVPAGSLVALFTNAPHYGATLLRVYEPREERQKFALFAVHATLILAVFFVAGIYNELLGSLLITVYATWSPWHFGGQNYGLGLMFLRRRGVTVTPTIKRLFYASFVLSVLLTVLVLHRGTGTLSVAPVPGLAGDYRLISLGIPPDLAEVAFWIAGGVYLAVIAALAAALLREAPARALVPTAALVGIQALWFSVPSFLHLVGRFDVESLMFSAFVISVAHSIQYLWVTSYYASRSDPPERFGAFFAKTVLVGAALFSLPALLLARPLLGAASYAAGFSTVLFAVVNIHHFILDGAIWKLRDGRVARVLLRTAPSPPARPAPATRATGAGWLRPALLGLGICFFGIEVFNAWEREFGIRRALFAERVDRAAGAARHLEWIGRADHGVYRELGFTIAQRQARIARERGGEPSDADFGTALAAYRRSIEIHATPEAWIGLGNTLRVSGDLDAALGAYGEAAALDPRSHRAFQRLGEAWLESGDLARSRQALRRAYDLAPRDERTRATIQKLVRAERRQAGGAAAR